MLIQEYISSITHGGFRSFLNRAVELGVNVSIILDNPSPRVTKLDYKGKTVVCVGDCIPVFRRASNIATRNKAVTKAVLSSFSIPTPRGILATSYEEFVNKLSSDNLSYPLIAKPVDQSLAKGVTWNIQSFDELKVAIEFAQQASSSSPGRSKTFLVEEMVPGDEYRILILNGAILSCVKKVPATVVGDGDSSISQLIEDFNKTRLPGFEIRIDETVLGNLQSANLSLDSVVREGEKIKLRNNLNMSDGGRSIECTNELGGWLQEACIRSLDALGMNYGGIDLITPSIADPSVPYVILEVNPLPYYNMHEKPLVEGVGIDVSTLLLTELFPNLKN